MWDLSQRNIRSFVLKVLCILWQITSASRIKFFLLLQVEQIPVTYLRFHTLVFALVSGIE